MLTPTLPNPPHGLDADLTVQWIDTGGTRVTVGGTGLDEAQLLDIARGLRETDEATWFDLQAAGVDEPGPSTSPPTTAAEPQPAPETSSDADDTSTSGGASATSIHVEGAYQGTEQYAPTTGGCPDLDHTLVSTFQLDDGSTWLYRSEYCGTLNGTHWTGAGTFEFTTPDGDAIAGTTSTVAEVPSPGVPLVLTITGGTGTYEGASGSCDLDNHLRQIEFGAQEQYGTFACEIAVAPRP